jgi:hypothetical protein
VSDVTTILVTKGTVPLRPGKLGPITIGGEVQIMALEHTIGLPPRGASDVVQRELSVTIGDATVVQVLDGAATEAKVLAQHNDAVSLKLTDVDRAGNRSPDSPTLTFTATDTFPPPAPGTLAVTSVVEVDDVPPTQPPTPPAPPPEPTPVT